MKKILIPVFALMLLFTTANYSMAARHSVTSEPSGGAMFFDMGILRPVGAFTLLCGTALYLISLPISVPTSSADTAAEKLVIAPFEYTFKRPLGHLD